MFMKISPHFAIFLKYLKIASLFGDAQMMEQIDWMVENAPKAMEFLEAAFC